jgi:hypothetical protein
MMQRQSYHQELRASELCKLLDQKHFISRMAMLEYKYFVRLMKVVCQYA